MTRTEAKWRVVWVDDDSPENPWRLDGIDIVPMRSCRQAAEHAATKGLDADWWVVDVLVPQKGWSGEEIHEYPGIEFIRYLRRLAGDKPVRIAAFSHIMTDRLAKQARDAGADCTEGKDSTVIRGLLRSLVGAQEKSDA